MYNWNDGTNVLMHHGILGQKWGIRRYQNSDGTLTEAGKRRLHKKYDSTIKGIQSRVTNDQTIQDRYFNAYNKAVERMNNGLTDKYNNDYDKKLGDKAKGHDYFNDEEYEAGYDKLFNDVFTQEYNSMLKSEILNDYGYKKVQNMIKNYGEDSLSDFAREHLAEIDAMTKLE